jgi:hypothetical protein
MSSGKQVVPFHNIAQEAQMTHNSIHRDFPVQKAGQADGTALPLPRIFSAGGSVRVAGEEAQSAQTSTAALGSFCSRLLYTQRRAPRHPAGSLHAFEASCKDKETNRSNEESK